MKKIISLCIVFSIVMGGTIFSYLKNKSNIVEYVKNIQEVSAINKVKGVSSNEIGEVVDSYKGVPVYNNGKDYVKNYGKSYSKDGYYYGYKWQCVEHVKRFYYEALKHKMPDGFGNAKDFFDATLDQGSLNKKRGLYQYKNGDNVKPETDDLIIFNDTQYGHVAIITEVTEDTVEIIQQNVYEVPRKKFKLILKDGKYFIGGEKERKPAGWLRKK